VPAGGSPTPGAASYPERLTRRRVPSTDPQPSSLATLLAAPLAPGPVRGAYRYLIDWSNNGLFAEADEDVSADVRNQPWTKITLGRDQAREYGPPAAGRGEYSLDNTDGRYSSANPASPLYGKLNPGLLDQIWVILGGSAYQLHEGYVDAPAERPGILQQLVAMTSLDGLAKLKAARISTAEYINIPINQAIGVCLDEAGWPATKRDLAAADTILARWCVDGVDAFTAIRDLVLTEGPGALFHVDRGRVVFENRHYRLLTPRCTSSQATFRGDTTEPRYGLDFAYDPGIRGVVNSCTVPVNSYVVGSLGVIWTGPTPVTLGPNQATSYTVTTSAAWFTSGLVPVAATDYTVTAGAVTPSLSRLSGKTAILTMTAGAAGATFTGLQVRAQIVTVSQQFVTNQISGASTSGVDYGVRAFPSDFIPSWVPDTQTAQAYADYVVSRYKDPVPQLTFSLDNGDSARLLQAITRRISDRVSLIENVRAFVNADFTIEQIAHALTEGGNQQTSFGCEQASSQAYWVLGQPGFSELGQTTKVGF
jgi:hypothetical protein